MTEDITKYKLPTGWAWVKLDDISLPVEKVNSEFENINAGFKYIDIESIDNSSQNIITSKDYTWGTAPSRAQQKIQTNDILFATVRPYLKNIAAVTADYNGQIASSGFCIIRPNVVSYKYIFYYVTSDFFIKPINKLAKGTSYPAVTAKIIMEQQIPLPTLEEQYKIVLQIDILFGKLDVAKKELQKAKRDLKIYKQALLKQAFEGKSTEKLEKHTELITKGASPKWQGINYTNDSNQILFITSENVHVNVIDLIKPKYVDSSFNKKQKRSILKRGDVLVNIVGASIGRAAVFDLDFNSNINQAVCLIRPKQNVNPKYISYYLNSPIAHKFYKYRVVDVARANLSLKDISEMPFPIYSDKEQIITINKLDAHFTLTDNLEKTIDNVLNEIIALKQSILKKAFEGKLVNYISSESVEKLLSDIQEEKRIYLENQKESNRSKPKQKKQMEEKKSILEILKESNSPISAQELWERSTSEGDIERFYSEIKEIYEQIEELKLKTESLLTLKDESK